VQRDLEDDSLAFPSIPTGFVENYGFVIDWIENCPYLLD
jgi:hypothetical protein